MSYDDLYTLMLFAFAIGFGGALLWRRRQLKKLQARALDAQATLRTLQAENDKLAESVLHSDLAEFLEKYGGPAPSVHTCLVAPTPVPPLPEEVTRPLWRKPECLHQSGQAVVAIEADKTTGLLNAGLRCPECRAWVMRSCNQCGMPQPHVNAHNLCPDCADPRGF